MTRTSNTRLPDGRLLLVIRLDPAEAVACLQEGSACCLSLPETPAGPLTVIIDARAGDDRRLLADAQQLAAALMDGRLTIQGGHPTR